MKISFAANLQEAREIAGKEPPLSPLPAPSSRGEGEGSVAAAARPASIVAQAMDVPGT